MMDELGKASVREIQHGGRTYRFQRPSANKLIRADMMAAQYRGNLPAGVLTYGAVFADAKAVLHACLVDPKSVADDPHGVDFGELPDDELLELYREVSSWLESFRRSVEST